MANIKVAVRIRPISARELKVTGSEVVVHIESKKISLINPKVPSSRTADSRKRIKQFSFDYCFDSSNLNADDYAGQEKIYSTLGTPVLESFLSGYNASVVAYGQSASGKSYTMIGPDDDPGLIPRICSDLFVRASIEEKNGKILRFFVSYLEIYNERVRDLLNTSIHGSCLRIREHPRSGPYVEGLTQYQVKNLNSLMTCLKEGTQARKTASTLQNLTSSRSHALLTLSLEFSNSSPGDAMSKALEKSPKRLHLAQCKLHLVDLAGSEKSTACAGISRLKEGANINKSLVALGNVISALAERSSTSHVLGKRFIPYRDSTLTWLLKDSFGGNATTIMLATISPAGGSYNETAHTLRFAQRAQSVINKPVISEDPVSKIIRELQAEICRLKAQLFEKNTESNDNQSSCICHNNHDRAYPQQNLTKCLQTVYFTDKLNYNLPPSIISRRHSFDDILISKFTVPNSLKKIGSLESIPDHKNSTCIDRSNNYNPIELSKSVNNNFDEAFVDIPTLVAVLINPDTNVPEDTHQIEEIPNSPHADTIEERTFINVDLLKEPDQIEKVETENLSENTESSQTSLKHKTTPLKPLKQSDLISKSLENIEEISNDFSNLSKKTNDLKVNGKEKLQNLLLKPNDRETKAIFQSHEALKKQFSEIVEQKVVGGTDSKDDAPTEITKAVRRNSSGSEHLLPRQHTVIQRIRRADIVAAVTERLYSIKKPSEDSNTASTPASDFRSPEGSEVKFPPVTRMRLREISRKMLAKRRRVCADTQTDAYPTVRVRDAGISATEPKIVQKDASILTDRHEDYETLSPCSTPVLRLKEMATSTSDPLLLAPVTLLKDAGSVTEYYNDVPACCSETYDTYETNENATNTPIDEPRHSYVQTHSNSCKDSHPCMDSQSCKDLHPLNVSESKHCQQPIHSCNNNSTCCPTIPDCAHERTKACHKITEGSCQCSHTLEKNVISLSVPDTINITIESSNALESKLQIFDNESEYKQKNKVVQTEHKLFSHVETLTAECKRVNIRESWTNTRLIDAQTDTRFRFRKLLDDSYETSKSSRVSTFSDPNDLDSLPTFTSFDKRSDLSHTYRKPHLFDKDYKSATKEWLTKNRQCWMPHQCYNGFKHLSSSSKSKNVWNLDNVTQSELTNRARNVLRHYSWRNIRSSKFNNLDKKLRQWNRLNFTNQITSPTKTSELSWTDNNLYDSKVIHSTDFGKQNVNFSDDSFNSKVKSKCAANAVKTLDLLNGTKGNVKQYEHRSGVVHFRKDLDSFIFPDRIYSDDFNDEYIGLPTPKSHFPNEILAIHGFKPHFSNLFLIPIILSGNEVDIKANEALNEQKSLGKSSIIIPTPTKQCAYMPSPSFLQSNSKDKNKLPQSCMNFTKLPQGLDENFELYSEKPKKLNDARNYGDLKGNHALTNQNLIKDYLKETIMFMRNINLMTELVNTEAIKHKLTEKSRNDHLDDEKVAENTLIDDNVDEKALTSSKLEDLLHFNNFALRRQLPKNTFIKNNDDISHKIDLDFKEENYYNKLIDVSDNFPLKFNNSTVRKFLNARILNDYLKLRNNSARMKKRRNSAYSGGKSTNDKLTNDFMGSVDLNEFNSHVYLKITGNKNDFIAKGRKLLTPRFTLSKYDSSDNSSSNDAFAHFIESIHYKYKYKNKLKISPSPRLKLLELLSERRQIIENSRDSSLS